MRKILSLREVVRSSRSGGGGWELCATADATYDPARATLLVELDSLVQPVDLPPGVNGFRQPWLPAKKVLQRRVPLPKARMVVRDIFQRWLRKVRRTIPARVDSSLD